MAINSKFNSLKNFNDQNLEMLDNPMAQFENFVNRMTRDFFLNVQREYESRGLELTREILDRHFAEMLAV